MSVIQCPDRTQQRPPKQDPFDYAVLTNLEEIAALSVEWDGLLAISRCNRAFSCSKWYLATPQLLPHLEPFVFIARRNGALVGILPLWLDTHKKEAGFPDDYSDHLDIIASDQDLDVMAGLLSLAIQNKWGYDKLALKHIKPDSNCVKAAQILGLFREEAFAPGKSLDYAVLDLSRGYDSYAKTLSRKFRLHLNGIRSKAEREQIVVCELKPESFEPKRFPGIFWALHESRFGKNTSLRSVCKSPEQWIHNLYPALFAEARLRVFAILIKDQIVGIDLATVANSGMYGWNGGFLPEIERYHPGKLLILQAIHQCCQEGLAEYDMGWFGQEYKAQWRPTIRQIGELQFNTTRPGNS
jgi:Acetyltransferase (GNAT) domain